MKNRNGTEHSGRQYIMLKSARWIHASSRESDQAV